MRTLPLESKDVTLFLAIKPYMSTKAQQLLDVLLFFIRFQSQTKEDMLDPLPILNLLNFAKTLSYYSAGEKELQTPAAGEKHPFIELQTALKNGPSNDIDQGKGGSKNENNSH
jgi:hypothetical protein